MNNIRKYLGVLWIVLGLLVAYFGISFLGIPKLTSGKQEDLVFGIIICFILLQIYSQSRPPSPFINLN